MGDGIEGVAPSAGKVAVGFSRTRQKLANEVVPPGNTRNFLLFRSCRIMHHDLALSKKMHHDLVDIKLLIVICS